MSFKPLINPALLAALEESETKYVEQCLQEHKLPLYEYQKQGLEFLLNHKRCILADEMGLGKTLQALALVKTLDTNNSMKVLVVCPKGAKPVWKMEIKKWLGEDADVVNSLDGWNVCAMKFLQPEKRFLVCNYEQLREFAPQAAQNPWHCVLFDEAHKLRNMATKVFKATEKFVAGYPLIPMVFITGTPLVNTPEDLYSLLRLIDKNAFPNKERFLSAWFYKWGTQYRHKNVERFQEFINKFMIRRMAKEVLDLPPVRYIETPIELEGDQKKHYIAMRDAWMAEMEGQKTILTTVVIAQITRLKQICLSPGLVWGEECCEGAKLDELLDILEERTGQVVITSCFSSYLRPLRSRLIAAGYSVGLIDGQTGEDSRANQVELFQEGELDLFLLSTRAGGVALTLTAANQMIFMDKPWTAADEDQAFKRIHRIGQETKVIKRYLKAVNTVEEYIEKVIDRKRHMFEQSIPASMVYRLIMGE